MHCARCLQAGSGVVRDARRLRAKGKPVSVSDELCCDREGRRWCSVYQIVVWCSPCVKHMREARNLSLQSNRVFVGDVGRRECDEAEERDTIEVVDGCGYAAYRFDVGGLASNHDSRGSMCGCNNVECKRKREA